MDSHETKQSPNGKNDVRLLNRIRALKQKCEQFESNETRLSPVSNAFGIRSKVKSQMPWNGEVGMVEKVRRGRFKR